MAEAEPKPESSPEPEPKPMVEPKSTGSVPEAGAKPGEVKPEPEPKPEPKPEPAPAGDWRDDRIRVLTARLNEERAKNAGGGVKPGETPGNVTNDPAEFERRVQTEAARVASEAEFNRACNDTAAAGRLAFPDFDTRTAELKRIVTVNDPSSQRAYYDMLSAAIETGDGPKILHTLGGDLNEAARIMALPPIKMAVELTKIASGQGRQVSGAAKPITPVGGRGASHDAIDPTDPERADKLSTAEWMKRMDERDVARDKGRMH